MKSIEERNTNILRALERPTAMRKGTMKKIRQEVSTTDIGGQCQGRQHEPIW
jgi:hypothetical protein